jgi:hypothetical protein
MASAAAAAVAAVAAASGCIARSSLPNAYPTSTAPLPSPARPALAFRSARNPVSNDRSVRFTTDPLSARGMDTIRLLPNNGMR